MQPGHDRGLGRGVQEEHAIGKAQGVDVQRLERLQVRLAIGAERCGVAAMQGFEQETRKLLSKGRRTETEMGVAAVTDAQERQPDELAVLRENLNTQLADVIQRQLATFWNIARIGDKKAAVELTSAGEHPREPNLDPIELAAYTGMANMILNLDEVVCKE